MIGTIAARELRSLFFSPLAWTMLAVIQVIVAFLFLAQVDLFLQIQPRLPQMPGAPGLTEIVVAPTFGNAALILLLVVPMLTMRLVSDELRNQTLSLLFSAPVSMSASGVSVGSSVGSSVASSITSSVVEDASSGATASVGTSSPMVTKCSAIQPSCPAHWTGRWRAGRWW